MTDRELFIKYEARVEKWKNRALAQPSASSEKPLRNDWDYEALEAIHLAKIEFIHETANAKIDDMDLLYFRLFDVFSLPGEYRRFRQWLLFPPKKLNRMVQRRDVVKVFGRDLHNMSNQGDDSPAIQLAFFMVRHVYAELDKLERRLIELEKPDSEIYAEGFLAGMVG